MLKYIEGFDSNGLTISVFEGDDIQWAKEHGFFQAEVEEAWDGSFWKPGIAPKTPPIDYLDNQMRMKRNQLLQDTDVYMVSDYPISETNRQKIKEYRQTLRDLPQQKEWPTNIIWPIMPKI